MYIYIIYIYIYIHIYLSIYIHIYNIRYKMTQYNTLNVMLSNLKLNKLKSVSKIDI